MTNGTSKGKAINKVAGGKLIKVSLAIEQGQISDIKITGDFFMHPEEKIEVLENLLKGTTTAEGDLRKSIDQFYNSDVEIIGIGSQDILETVLFAIENVE